MKEMVDRTRELELALGTEEKDVMENEKQSSIVQRRSIHAKRDIKKGEGNKRDGFNNAKARTCKFICAFKKA